MVRNQHPPADGGINKQMTRARHSSSRIEQEVQMMQADGKGEVQAYVVLALRPGNDVTVVTSKEIKSTVQPLMREWASSHLRIAHEYSGFVEEEEDDDDDDDDDDDESEDALDLFTTVNDLETCQHPANRLYHVQQPNTTLLRQKLTAHRKPNDWIVNHAFRIDNHREVANAMLSCLFFLQQNTLKKILKAWIKGICPRKQAKFPYRNKKGEARGKEVEIPPWWPSEDVCMFKEPDHTDKWQRLGLSLHFLRLRPTTQQFKEWNSGKAKQPVKTHTEHEWVAFLRELAPLSIVDEVSPNDPEKAERRKRVMQKLFDIATLEEEYKDDAVDGNTMVQPLEIDLRKVIVRRRNTKRARAPSVSPATFDDEMSESDVAITQPTTKKPKAAAQPNITAGQSPLNKPKQVTSAKPKRKTKTKTGSSSKRSKRFGDQLDCKPNFNGTEQKPPMFLPYGPGVPPNNRPMGSAATTPLHTSFGSNMSDVSSCDPYVLTPASPASDITQVGSGVSYHPHPHGLMQTGVQCHQVYEVPHPQFDTVPNTPNFSPSDMLPFDQQHPNLGPDMATLSLGMPLAGQQQNSYHSQPPHHPMHGLPSNTAPQSYRHWPEVHPRTYAYEIQPGVPPVQSQHAGFAVGFEGPQSIPGGANYFHAHPHFHSDNDMAYNNIVYGPSHELAPAKLPASVERGFTGHASGVGDSACPPGFGPYYN